MKKFTQTLFILLLATQYCFAQGFWSKVGDMPEIRYGHTADVLNGKIYVVGGGHAETSAGPRNALVYDLASKEWSQISLCNNKTRGAHSSCIVNGKLYVM
jgi:N-acetylneuraminic acid mutarotase